MKQLRTQPQYNMSFWNDLAVLRDNLKDNPELLNRFNTDPEAAVRASHIKVKIDSVEGETAIDIGDYMDQLPIREKFEIIGTVQDWALYCCDGGGGGGGGGPNVVSSVNAIATVNATVGVNAVAAVNAAAVAGVVVAVAGSGRGGGRPGRG